MKSENFILERVFMPVGQGAFYIEKFFDDFTVVYDCGSYKSTSIVEESIENSIINTKIDLLVISHYHEDHINGLEYVFKNFNVKRMLMPYMDLSEKVESYVDADKRNNTNSFYRDFCINPGKALLDNFGKSSEITFVYPEISKEANEISIQDMKQAVKSGDKILYDTNKYKWAYIAFNYQNRKRTNQFKKSIENISINTIDDFKKYYAQNKNEFIKIYDEISGDKNTNSLVLYSGLYSKEKTTIYSRRKNFNLTQNNMSGCLYLGDYEAKGVYKMRNLKASYASYFDNISTVQIPHHGSKHNYNSELNFKPNIISVISAGIDNIFSHPDKETLTNIILQQGIVILVTEEYESKFVQNIYLQKRK